MWPFKKKDYVKLYISLFNDLPPIISNISYDHPVYHKFIKLSIKNKRRIHLDELQEEFERNGLQCDRSFNLDI